MFINSRISPEIEPTIPDSENGVNTYLSHDKLFLHRSTLLSEAKKAMEKAILSR